MTDTQVRILTLIEQGRHFYQSGEWEEAQRCWQEVLRIDPYHPHATFLLQQIASSAVHPRTTQPPRRMYAPPPAPASQFQNGPVRTYPSQRRPHATPTAHTATPASHDALKKADFAVSETDNAFLGDDSFLEASAPSSHRHAAPGSLTSGGARQAWEASRAPSGGDQSYVALPGDTSMHDFPVGTGDESMQNIPLRGMHTELFDDLDTRATIPMTRPSPEYHDDWKRDQPDTNEQEQSAQNASLGDVSYVDLQPDEKDPWDTNASGHERKMLFAAAEELYNAEDYEGALEMLDILKQSTKDLPRVALRLRERCKHFLQKEYVEFFSDATQTPRLKATTKQMQALELDHRAGYLLSQIDGRTNLRELLLLSGLGEFEFLRTFHQLIQKGIIAL